MSTDPGRGDVDRRRLWRLVSDDARDAPPAAAPRRESSGPSDVRLDGVCRVAVAELDLMGAAIALPPRSGVHLVAAASDVSARRLEELQFDTAEGPTLEACRLRAPVLRSDLTSGGLGRWPGFTQAAVGAGVGAAFAFPLHVGASLLGAMTLYRPESGPLPPPGLPAALVLCDIAVEILVYGPLAGTDRAVGGSVPGAGGSDGDDLFEGAIDGQAQVYQAQGMVMVQLGVTLVEALARMRAYAYAQDLTLAALSAAIIDGVITLAEGEPG